MHISAPGTAEAWLPIPNDLGGLTTKKIMKWAQPTVRDLLPGRLFSPHPKQMFLQTLLGSVAQISSPVEQYFVHLAELPDEVLMVRVRWAEAGPSLDERLEEFVGPGDSQDVTVGAPEPSTIAPGVEGLRAPLERRGSSAGWVASFPVGDLAVQLRVEVPPEYLEDLQPDIENLAQALRAA
ncbi:hypothetical protein [Curtobacterium luteum]|nr:hypothetical protein [Curtobacterium luteum]